MKKKYIVSFWTFLCIFCCMTTMYAFTDRKILMGTINLPTHFGTITSVRIWHGGIIIPSNVDQNSKRISFELSVDKSQTFFYVVVVNDITPHIENKTVKYFAVGDTADYKIFSLKVIGEENSNPTHCSWQVHQLHIPLTRIPDDAIIVYVPGSYIEDLDGGSHIELPRIVFKKELNEYTVYDMLTQQLLKAINYDTLHSTITREVKQDHALKTLVAFNTN